MSPAKAIVRAARIASLFVVAWSLVLGAASAWAQPSTSGERPWQRGVSRERQAAAEAEFRAGNDLFERSDYAAAAERYRKALESWDHPGIQFNLAVCLINLDRPLDAFDVLQASLRFGQEGLRDHFDEANNYVKLLRDRIATLEVEIPQGAAATLDGEALVPDRGRVATRRLTPGRHSLVARKAGFEVWSKDLVLAPGVTREVIALRKPRTRTVRRWSPVLPWTVVGTGLVAAALGSAGVMIGNADLHTVDSEVARRCPPPSGCTTGLPADLAKDADRARLKQKAGVSVMAVGGAAVVAGVMLLVLNQPRQVIEAPRVSLSVSSNEFALGWTHDF